MPPYSWRPALGGRREYGGHAFSLAGEGCAGRFASGRGVDRSLRSLSNRPGLRVPATPSSWEGVGGRVRR